MSFAASLSAMLLAGVFVVAAIAKLLDRAGTRETLAEFGVPARAAAPGAVALPLLELAIAVALVPSATAVGGAVAGLATLLVFTAAIAVTLARGAAPDCNCFGGLSRTAVGRGTLVRDALLAAIAAFAAAAGTDGAIAWIRDAVADDRGWVIAIVALAALALGLAWFCWQLLRQNGRLLPAPGRADLRARRRRDLRSWPRGRGDRARLRPREPRRAADLARGAARAGPARRAGLHRSGLRRLPRAARARRARPARRRADGRDRRAGERRAARRARPRARSGARGARRRRRVVRCVSLRRLAGRRGDRPRRARGRHTRPGRAGGDRAPRARRGCPVGAGREGRTHDRGARRGRWPRTSRQDRCATPPTLARATQSYADLTVRRRDRSPMARSLSSRMRRRARQRLGDGHRRGPPAGTGRCPRDTPGARSRAYAALGDPRRGVRSSSRRAWRPWGHQQGIDAAASAEERLRDGRASSSSAPRAVPPMSASGHEGFLDALARRTVAGETAEPTPPPTRHVLSRRVFMRIAGAVALTGGALRVVTPTAAIAPGLGRVHQGAHEGEHRDPPGLPARPERGVPRRPSSRYDSAQALLRGSQTAKQRAGDTEAGRRSAQRDDGRARWHDQVSVRLRQATERLAVQLPGHRTAAAPAAGLDQPSQPPQNQASNGTCPGETFACPGQDGRCCYNGTFCCGCGCCIYNRLPLLRDGLGPKPQDGGVGVSLAEGRA